MGSPLSLKNTHTCLSGWMRDHWFNESMMDFIYVHLPWGNHYCSDRGMGVPVQVGWLQDRIHANKREIGFMQPSNLCR